LVIAGLSTFFLFGCNKNTVYESNRDLAGNQWYIDTIPSFSFKIEDTTATYNLSLNLRNSISYPYYNIFLRYTLLGPSGEKISGRQMEVLLMDSKTGRPLGKGTGDIFDNQFVFLEKQRFAIPGVYKITYKQYMRQDPLPEIMSVGLKVETGIE
ncbi:MAG: gliding motility lipoprotein GldH, partial [Cytophagales bacterium]|nr:gliding motility lipoprotein GldH [Cytophagales bacterium]